MLRNKKQIFLILAATVIIPIASWVVAQGTQIISTPDGTIPRGLTMDRVRQIKGEPKEEIGPVGEPPITKWVFPDGEVVVFETNISLDSFYLKK